MYSLVTVVRIVIHCKVQFHASLSRTCVGTVNVWSFAKGSKMYTACWLHLLLMTGAIDVNAVSKPFFFKAFQVKSSDSEVILLLVCERTETGESKGHSTSHACQVLQQGWSIPPSERDTLADLLAAMTRPGHTSPSLSVHIFSSFCLSFFFYQSFPHSFPFFITPLSECYPSLFPLFLYLSLFFSLSVCLCLFLLTWAPSGSRGLAEESELMACRVFSSCMRQMTGVSYHRGDGATGTRY